MLAVLLCAAVFLAFADRGLASAVMLAVAVLAIAYLSLDPAFEVVEGFFGRATVAETDDVSIDSVADPRRSSEADEPLVATANSRRCLTAKAVASPGS